MFEGMQLLVMSFSMTSCLCVFAVQQQHSHHHRILSRKYHEETSFALLESGAQIVDVRQVLQETISNVNQLRFVEEQVLAATLTTRHR